MGFRDSIVDLLFTVLLEHVSFYLDILFRLFLFFFRSYGSHNTAHKAHSTSNIDLNINGQVHLRKILDFVDQTLQSITAPAYIWVHSIAFVSTGIIRWKCGISWQLCESKS